MTQEVYMLFPHFKKKALTLSYDDGVVQDERLLAIFGKYGLRGTFNLNSGLFADDFGRMSQEKAVSLYAKYGQEVAAHGVKHLSLVKLSADEMEQEIGNDKKALERLFRVPITGMAYAYGATNDNVIEILKKCGIEYARLAGETGTFALPTEWHRWQPTCHHNSARLFPLCERFVNETEECPWLFYLWGHSYEFDEKGNWDVIERFAAYMSGRANIWYATNGEINGYVKAYEQLQWTDESMVYNPTDVDVYICAFGNHYKIGAGKKVDVQPKL